MAGATKLLTAGGGGVILTPDSSIASDVTVQIPAANGTVITTASSGKVVPTAALPAGTVLQVVNATTSTQVSVNTNTFTDTGLSATITPTSATSKILVLTTIMGLAKDGNNTADRIDLKILRNGAQIGNTSGANLYTQTTLYLRVGWAHSVLDSPATTSALTYKWQFQNAQSAAGNVYVQKDSNSGDSSITLLEIAA